MEKYIENSDAFDYKPGGPVSVDYLLTIVPEHVKKLIEGRQGRAFIHLAREWSEERRGPSDDAKPMKRWTKIELDSALAYLEATDATKWTHEDHYLSLELLVQRYLANDDTRTEGEWREQFAKLRAKVDANIENSQIPGWLEEQKKKPIPFDPDFADWMNKKLYPDPDKLLFIENEGALFRGPARGIPIEVWDGSKFVPYPPARQSRPITWGNIITEDDAKKMMAAPSNDV